MAKMSRSGFQAAPGFTLPELMMVLAVMAILVAMAIPNFARMTARDRVEVSAYDLQRRVALARQKAIAKRTQYRVVFDPAASTYTIECYRGGTWIPDPGEVFASDPSVNFTVDLNGDPANLDLLIEPMGTIDRSDGPARIVFTNQRGDSAVVSIVRTGRIRTKVY